MKKIKIIIFSIVLLCSMIGCKQKDEQITKTADDIDYVVVKISNSKKVKDLFQFTSIENTSITDFSNLDIEEGVYSLGYLSNGYTILWFSSDDGYGYDDCLFMYIEKKVETSSIITYAQKLGEEPITYNEFLNNYYQENNNEIDETAKVLEDLTEMLENDEYEEIVDFFKLERNNMEDSIYYYQNGEIVNELLSGKATILFDNGIYVGEIQDYKRSGQGKQLGIYVNDYSYIVATGTWKNDKLNGNATYYEPNITVASSKSEELVNFTYEGNFTDNYYDGEIKAKWQTPTGIYYGTFNANMGKVNILREENGKYIYLDNGNGYYWYFSDSTALESWMVWDGRDAK